MRTTTTTTREITLPARGLSGQVRVTLRTDGESTPSLYIAGTDGTGAFYASMTAEEIDGLAYALMEMVAALKVSRKVQA